MNPNTFSAVAFLAGTSPDAAGRYVAEYLSFPPEKWEECHNHIQWAFPSNIPSDFNPDAPVIDWNEFIRILGYNGRDPLPSQASYQVFENIRNLMMDYFHSIAIVPNGSEAEIVTNYPERLSWLMNKNDHNHRRITRVMMLWHYIGHYYMDTDINFHTFVNKVMTAIKFAFMESPAYCAVTEKFWHAALYDGVSPSKHFLADADKMQNIITTIFGKKNV